MALKTPRKKEPFKPPASAETQFGRALRKVARFSGHIVEAHVNEYRIHGHAAMNQALNDYSKLITPWAELQAQKMLDQVSKSNRRSYNSKSNKIAQELKNADPHVLLRAQQLHRDQVKLITTIPLKAGIRAQELAMQATVNGKRADEVAAALQASTKVSESDAMRIARTEVAKANAAITQARAQSIGSQAYIWRTTMDGAERPSHKAMNGKLIKYDSIPTLIDGTQGHAGEFINCRCYQDVQFDDSQ